MKFSYLSLRSKLLVILLPLGFLYCVAVAYFFINTTDNLLESNSIANEKLNSEIMKKIVDDFESKALNIAVIFSKNDAIKEAYTNLNDTIGSDLLMKSIKPIISEIMKDNKINDFQIHYHKAPAKSFLRSWTKKRFDDLSKFRPTILEVSKTKEPLKAIEFGVGGFAIRGIAPIIFDGDYKGSVEFLYDIKDVINLLTTDTTQGDMFNIVSSNVAENALKKEQIEKFYKQKIGNFYLSEPNAEWNKPIELLDETTLNEMENSDEVIVKNKGHIFYSLNPIFDLNKAKIGYVAFVKNNTQIIDAQSKEIFIKVALISIMVIIFIILIILTVDYFILKPIRKATLIALKVANGDLS